MNDTTVIEQVEQKALDTIAQAQKLVIQDNEQYVKATDFLKAIKGIEREIEEAFDPIIEKAHLAHKEALAQKDKYYKPLLNAERLIKTKIADYNMEQERIRREQEDKLRREAEAKEKKLREQAALAKKNGDKEKAEKLLDKADNIVAPTLASTVEKVDGVTFRENWYAEVVDLKLVPREFLVPDMKKLNDFARAYKDTRNIPGVRIRCEKIVSSTAR